MKYHFNDKGIRIYRVQGNYPTRKAIKLHPDLLDHLKSRHPPRIRKSDSDTVSGSPGIRKIFPAIGIRS